MKKKISLIIGIVIFVILAVGSISSPSSSGSGDSNRPSTRSNDVNEQTTEEEVKEEYGKVGEPYVTNHFEVTVNKVDILNSLRVNSIYDFEKEDGVKYLVITVSAKNIANESKSLITGGKIYLGENDDQIAISSESILSDGYDIFLDSVNPKLSKKTKLVYKIPAEYADKTIIWDAFGSNKYIVLQ